MNKGGSLFEGYQLANWDVDNPTVALYAGFLSRAGEWYIAKYLMATKTVGYIRGEENYSVNWTGRAGLTYAPFDQAF